MRHWVRKDHEAMRAAPRGRLVMVARDKFVDSVGELVAEGGALRCLPEPNLGVQRQRRQSLVGFSGTTE